MKIEVGMTVRDEMGLIPENGGRVEKIELLSYDVFDYDRWGEERYNLCHVRVSNEVFKIAEDRLTSLAA